MAAVRKKTYQVTDLPFTPVTSKQLMSSAYDNEIRSRIRAVIQKEAPVTEWLLIKRVLNSFDIWRAGVKIREYMTEILNEMDLTTTGNSSGLIYWKKNQGPLTYKEYRVFGSDDLSCRDVTQVPFIELANAISACLVKENGLAEKELIRKAALVMGYTRIGSNVRTSFHNAIELAVSQKKIQRSKGIFKTC